MATARRFAPAALLVSAALILATHGEAAARSAGGGAGPFGLGVVVGQPTGLTLQWYRRAPGFGQAIELAIGLDAFEDEDLYFHLVWKFYLTELGHGRDLVVPLYTGIGGFVYDHGNDRFNDTHIGARAPLGIALEFHSVPIEIFFELALLVTVIEDPDRGDDIGVGGALGFRYYF